MTGHLSSAVQVVICLKRRRLYGVKYMPQFELSQNSMFKNIVNFKPSFGIRLYVACVHSDFSLCHVTNIGALLPVGTMTTEPLSI